MSSSRKPILIVQGAQWGSEAKGAVAAFLTQEKRVNIAVRTGAVNAGHTVVYKGHPYKMQQLPTAWVVPGVKLILGAGTFIHPTVLKKEIEMVNEALLHSEDIRDRLVIDNQASIHLPEHQAQAKESHDHVNFGATGKGCSKAIIDKLQNRGKGYQLFKPWLDGSKELKEWMRLTFCDTVNYLHDSYDRGERILLEGTQGSLLDLHLGPYPFTTHKQTQASQWVVESGLSPNMEFEVALVARTYPIRVAGNSGPMSRETTWANIGRNMNRLLMLKHMPQRVKSFAIEEWDNTWIKAAQSQPGLFPKHMDGSPNHDMHKWTPEQREQFKNTLSIFPGYVMSSVSLKAQDELFNLFEFTTVTNKLRRVAEWNGADVAWAAKVNRASYIVLTFFNYWFPETWSQRGISWDKDPAYRHAIIKAEKEAGCPIKWATTGPASEHFIAVGSERHSTASVGVK